MLTNALELTNFAWYRETQQWLPASGLTLITGRNGSGKSTLIEGVCWILYGETVRGAAPETAAGPCSGSLAFTAAGHEWYAERSRSNAKTLLRLLCDGTDVSGQTATETQRKIEGLLGPWNRFVSTRVFSREFMARFGSSTDKERKALLEGMLGLEQFDAALAAARADLNLQQRALASAERAVQTHGESLSKIRARLDSMDPPTVPAAELQGEVEKAEADLAAKETAHGQVDNMARKAAARAALTAGEVRHNKQTYTAAQERIKRLKGRWSTLLTEGSCPACRRAITTTDQEGFGACLEAERAPLEAEVAQAEENLASAELEAEEAIEESTALQVRAAGLDKGIRAARHTLGLLRTAKAQAEGRERERTTLEQQATEAEQEQLRAQVELDSGRHRAAVIEVAVEALGLRGARTLLLGRALGRLEVEANAVLGELGYPIKVRVRGTDKLKSGREVDAISIATEGACGAEYRALSTSEKSRVDTALLLGLASLLAKDDGGLIAFDEVFDSLDEEGIEPLAAYLAKLSERRQVVVISHHPELRSLFPRGDIIRIRRGDDGASVLEAA